METDVFGCCCFFVVKCTGIIIVGIYDVMHDNRTEHLRTINILERFNIYQEVILAALYRILPIQVCLKFLFFSNSIVDYQYVYYSLGETDIKQLIVTVL